MDSEAAGSNVVQVPESHWLRQGSPRRASKARMFGQIGLVLWAFWVAVTWRLSSAVWGDSGWWWRQVLQQASFWLALVFTAIWVAFTVWRDERSSR